MKQGTAIIIGAGPAGLTAGLELIRRSGIKPILLEAGSEVGGLSRTVTHNGNRMDIGGHRFFSKSDRVMQWWLDLMPIEASASDTGLLRYQGSQREIPAFVSGPGPQVEDRLMLLRPRKSRIYFLRRFFDYPIRVNFPTLMKLGPLRALRCGLSYLRSALAPRSPERSLEDFLINRFGRQLYEIFYKSYTEKVWGVPCGDISAEWGAQRIKGLSLRTAIAHSLKGMFVTGRPGTASRKQMDTSLIEKFLYPKFGPGQLWEHVAEMIRQGGGEIHLGTSVDRVAIEGNKIVSVESVDNSGERTTWRGDYFVSTMPVRDLIHAMGAKVPKQVAEINGGLCYRDFIIIGLLARKLLVTEDSGAPLKDNWIYIQDPDVKAGRLQIFNNWSPWMVSRPDRVWIGLEYFCNESDSLWRLPDAEVARLAVEEAARVGIINADDIEDSHVVRAPKAYPAYFGSYHRFEVIRNYVDGFPNLFLVGRNGMHKYNNQDHSMLTAMIAVENILRGVTTRDNIWAVNTEMEYQEETSRPEQLNDSVRTSADPKVAVAG